ncbi:ATP-dependent helicase HrpB [Saccharibacillus sp. CPCC 101409]|uniref:ATP-dependent helicase HrpB n=1 Tax=Saccharibacillus sp. CPCC 101409 TaxID=3058041 RepID=UPI00267183AC|nr:ATP-dependent helicase HrpB [Saccharibacillus sp. CPCC 101409]MDO3411692.1 ATP-dependent helicase HrpB [Saccharibacillus sp. CPCC 101409]
MNTEYNGHTDRKKPPLGSLPEQAGRGAFAGSLPVDEALPLLKKSLADNKPAILIAQPGAGKTTRVPLALLGEPWLEGRKILILEPRRLAAVSAADYMAESLGERTGETVGYRISLDSKSGARTRIEVVTEGILTRMLQSDPSLEEAGLVIFDEFHERNLQADLGLALALQSRAVLREDLRILVMSATIDPQPVSRVLGGAEVIRSEGRVFPVETVYAAGPRSAPLERRAADAARRAWRETEGSILVFLPGVREIGRAREELLRGERLPGAEILPLHGGLGREEQRRAVNASAEGRRKIILSTSLAESSITVEGVTAVVDSGLIRTQTFSPRTGMSRLVTLTESLESADQRRGRAGRTAPGVCYRLWSREEEAGMPAARAPEMLQSDLAPLALELAAWGAANPAELDWIDMPPEAGYAGALELLRRLHALDEAGRITAEGRAMSALGVHPRLARMIRRALALGLGETACDLAALLQEQAAAPAPSGGAVTDAVSLLPRLAALQSASARGRSGARTPEERAAERAARLRRIAGLPPGPGKASPQRAGLLLAFAFPDRVARRRGSGRFLLSGGRGAYVPERELLSREEYLVAADIDDQGAEGRIWLAAPLEPGDLEEFASLEGEEEIRVEWDDEREAVSALRVRRIGAVILSSSQAASPGEEDVAAALLHGIRRSEGRLLPWTKEARELQNRMIFMHRADEAFPASDDASLLADMENWLLPFVSGIRSGNQLRKLELARLLEQRLSWEQRRRLDTEAPTRLGVPSGSRIAIDYSDPERPFIAVKLQEMFGQTDTPRIGGGRIPVTVQLLSPARRPVQITADLANFWRETYFEVKKDLKGRYPKHYWPDDPSIAEATRRVRPKS